MIDGSSLYLASGKVDKKSAEKSIGYLKTLTSKYNMVIVDHHMIRDPAWMDIMERLRTINRNAMSMAKYVGMKPRPLEYMGRELSFMKNTSHLRPSLGGST